MDIKVLKEKQIVNRDGHFIPLVFVDMSIPTALVGGACMCAGKTINQSLNENKFSLPESFVKIFSYTPICAVPADLSVLKVSLDDIKY